MQLLNVSLEFIAIIKNFYRITDSFKDQQYVLLLKRS